MSRNLYDYFFSNDKKGDTSSAYLPSTRKEQYFRLIKTRFSKLVFLSLFSFLFFAPSLVWVIYQNFYKESFDINSIEYISKYMSFTLSYSLLVRILFNILAFIGLNGLLYSVRILSWGLPFNFFNTFFRGIKLSIKQSVTISILYTFISTLVDIGFTSYLFYQNGNFIINLLLIGLYIMLVLVLSMALMFLITMGNLYNMKFMTSIKFSFILAVKYSLKNLLMFLITIIPMLIVLLIGNVLWILIFFLLLAIFGLSHIALVLVLYTNSIYDEHINKKDYIEYYRKGLYKAENA